MAFARTPDALRSGPFTTAMAREHGVSHSALQSPPWRRMFRDVWVHRAVEDTRELRLAAVRLILPPGAVLVGLTAAWLHGADVRHENDLDIHVGYPKGKRGRRRTGLIPCQETLDPSDIVTLDGVPVTSATRTAFDCARWLRGVERIVVVDAMTHLRLTSIPAIRDYISGKKRLRNMRRAERLLDQCDPKAQSPMETRLRMLLVGTGFIVETQIPVYDGDRPDPFAYLDMGFPDCKVAIEYDGALHWWQRRADDRRRDRIRDLGWIVLVFSSDDYYGTPQLIVATVWRHIQRRRFAAI